MVDFRLNTFLIAVIVILIAFANVSGSTEEKSTEESSLNVTCSESAACSIENSECVEGICHCQKYYIAVNSSNEPDSCQSGVPNHLSCLRQWNWPGYEDCLIDKQCQASAGALSQCSSLGLCECLPEAVRVSMRESFACLPRAKFLGDLCEYRQQCETIPNSECSEDRGICVCLPDYVLSHTKKDCIVPAKRLGDSCGESDSQCNLLPNSECSLNNICECRNDDFVENELRTGCLPMMSFLWEKCEEDAQCLFNNTACVHNQDGGRCLCKPDFELVNLSGNVNCYERKNAGDSCTGDIQCYVGPLGVKSKCDEVTKTCVCQEGYTIGPHGICFQPNSSKINQNCTVDEECVDDFVCVMGLYGWMQCWCPPHLVDPIYQDYNCVEKTEIGGPCSTNMQCEFNVGKSICEEATKTCQCPQRYVNSADGSQCLPVASGPGRKCEETSQCPKGENGELIAVCDAVNNICKCVGGYVAEGDACVKDS